MMESVAEAAAALAHWRNFEECLMQEVRSVRGFYSAEIDFNYVWDEHGYVRERVLEAPQIVTLRLVGIEDFHLIGALTVGMRRSPDAVSWGLAEVARVSASRQESLLKLSIEWESARSLTVTCSSVEFDEPNQSNS